MNREKFDRLSLQHVDAVYRMAMQLARHPDEAADLVQETYLKALAASAKFEESGAGIRAWLFKILHNAFYTRVTKARREVPAGDNLPEQVSDENRPDQPPPVWDLASLSWEYVDERIKRAIERLKPEYRAALLLWGVEGMKYREIAEVQEVPIGTVMSRLHRARSILAEQLTELAEEKRLSGSWKGKK